MKIFSPQFMREGPGVNKNEPSKEGISLFFQLFFTRFWDMIKLNIIFIIYCIPIITIGPALSALTSINISMIQRRHIYILSDFHKAFKANWKQSLICSFICTFIFTLLGVAIFFYFKKAQENTIFHPLVFICLFITILLGLASLYIYPLLSTISLSVKDIFKNSIFLSITCLKNTLAGALAYGLILGINLVFFPLTIPLILIFTFSVLSFISSFTAWSGIKKYIIK
jgi:uncharacterized membrane protein YesL